MEPERVSANGQLRGGFIGAITARIRAISVVLGPFSNPRLNHLKFIHG